MIISMLFILFAIVVFVLLFFMGLIMKGITSISEVWRNITGKGQSERNTYSGGTYSGTGGTSQNRESDSEPVIGGSSRTDLSSVKDVEFEKEDQ